MRKTLLFFIFLFAFILTNALSFAETKTVMAAGALEVPNIFLLEFYDSERDKYLYTTNVPFMNISDPTRTHVMADGRAYDDGKNDVGLVCRTNLGITWRLKIQVSPADSPLVSIGEIKYYLGQPWNRTTSKPADGTLAQTAAWYRIPSVATALYTAGPNDLNNLPYGTLCSFSFAINPSRLDPGQIYTCTISYTLTTDM